jgi:hypothetical protein
MLDRGTRGVLVEGKIDVKQTPSSGGDAEESWDVGPFYSSLCWVSRRNQVRELICRGRKRRRGREEEEVEGTRSGGRKRFFGLRLDSANCWGRS